MEIYEELWQQAAAAFARGQPELDRHLRDRASDRRRGVSLILRPAPTVRDRIAAFVDRLAAEFPGQYFYRAEEFHVTVLTLISASERWREEIKDVARYRELLRAIRGGPFEIEFRGVTASPGAVMIQGFPVSDSLEQLRQAVRVIFGQNGFANRLDRRYRTTTAHITVMRFASAAADWPRLRTILSEQRNTRFGETSVERMELVWGDWYGSAENFRTLENFPLRAAAT